MTLNEQSGFVGDAKAFSAETGHSTVRTVRRPARGKLRCAPVGTSVCVR